MKTLLLATAAAVLQIGFAAAQAPPTAGSSSATGAMDQPLSPGATRGSGAGLGGSLSSPSDAGLGSSGPVQPRGSNSGKAAASGDSNQAIATTSAHADQPAKGANSFTEGEARSRIEAQGFTNVSGLSKGTDGVWRGKAQKDGRATGVWLDYKGNIGQQS